MKKRFLTFACILGISVSCLAQSPVPTDEEIKTQRAASLEQMATAAKEVGSTEKEIAQLKTVFENLFKKSDEIKADATLMPEAKKEKLKAANAEKDWKVKNILGDKLKAYSEARKRLMAEAEAKKKQQ